MSDESSATEQDGDKEVLGEFMNRSGLHTDLCSQRGDYLSECNCGVTAARQALDRLMGRLREAEAELAEVESDNAILRERDILVNDELVAREKLAAVREFVGDDKNFQQAPMSDSVTTFQVLQWMQGKLREIAGEGE